MLRFAILGLLRRGERLHGYALWKAYTRTAGQVIQNGRFYRTLKILAEAGLIRVPAAPASDPRRTPYEITAAGSMEFDDWVADAGPLETLDDDALAQRARFAFALPAEVATAFFQRAAAVLSARWKSLEHQRERAVARADDERSTRALLLQRDLERTSADLAWLREAHALYDRARPQPATREAAACTAVPRRRVATRA